LRVEYESRFTERNSESQPIYHPLVADTPWRGDRENQGVKRLSIRETPKRLRQTVSSKVSGDVGEGGGFS